MKGLWIHQSGDSSYCKMLLHHYVNIETIMTAINVTDNEDWNTHCVDEEEDIPQFSITTSTLNSANIVSLGWFFGSYESMNKIDMAAAIMAHKSWPKDTPIEFQDLPIRQYPDEKIHWTNAVKVPHLMVASENYHVAVASVSGIYNHKNKGGFPRHQKLLFVADVASKSFISGGDSRPYELAGHMRTEQKKLQLTFAKPLLLSLIHI